MAPAPGGSREASWDCERHPWIQRWVPCPAWPVSPGLVTTRGKQTLSAYVVQLVKMQASTEEGDTDKAKMRLVARGQPDNGGPGSSCGCAAFEYLTS